MFKATHIYSGKDSFCFFANKEEIQFVRVANPDTDISNGDFSGTKYPCAYYVNAKGLIQQTLDKYAEAI